MMITGSLRKLPRIGRQLPLRLFSTPPRPKSVGQAAVDTGATESIAMALAIPIVLVSSYFVW